MSVASRRVSTRGVVFIHSAPAALCPHINWALESATGSRVSIDWTAQPAAPGLMRGEWSWIGEQGTGARLTSTLRGWQGLRYEVTEDPSAGCDGSRWSHTLAWGSTTPQPQPAVTPWSTRSGSRRSCSSLRVRPRRSRRCSRRSSAPTGTTSSSRSATPVTAHPSAGCTRSAELSRWPPDRRERWALGWKGSIRSLDVPSWGANVGAWVLCWVRGGCCCGRRDAGVPRQSPSPGLTG